MANEQEEEVIRLARGLRKQLNIVSRSGLELSRHAKDLLISLGPGLDIATATRCDQCGEVNPGIKEYEIRDDAVGYVELIRICEICFGGSPYDDEYF